MSSRRVGIRVRILAIALIPSLALFAVGVGAAGYLSRQSDHVKTWSSVLANANLQARDMISAVQQERLLSLAQLIAPQPKNVDLVLARHRLDQALDALTTFESQLSVSGISQIDSVTAGFDVLKTRLPEARAQIDTGTISIADTYGLYSGLLEGVAVGTELIGKSAPDPRVAFEFANEVRVVRAMEAMSRSSALAVAMLGGAELPGSLSVEYRNMVGYYHTELAQLSNDLGGARAKTAELLIAAPEWQRISAMDDLVLQRSSTEKPGLVPMPASTVASWRDDIDRVHDQLLELWQAQNEQANQVATDYAAQTSRYSLLTGSGVLLLAVIAFCASLWIANRLSGRLQRLRAETLALAEHALPETMRRLAMGQSVAVENKSGELDFGGDEVGEVADAFNRAYAAAIAAAVTEARTREGVRRVFLNIAHRSQLVVHRQLELLDEAEREQEDPQLLDIFFKLDHLATRERRNAENLVILGGGQPSRRWSRPVPLLELVRSAAGEALEYSRVRTTHMPQVSVVGDIVADLIHLFAELVDNATHFSPPQSRVDIVGKLVGKGVAVEVNDQGIGMPEDASVRANKLLSHPADFDVIALSQDVQLGLFVVAKLAIRHGISVRLTESDHGGLKAIVLIPVSLLVDETSALDRTSQEYKPGVR
ncbi:nitrate- and nitrite sensing domain-containing protein [Nocardia sp. NPDC006630]|uniref:sensor histidine kinase n=1 Tax=Nocardia sp. NPDC006630 TaxID=3157181 RepID=UPI0033AD67A5